MARGQLLTIDFAFSLVIFLSILLTLTALWGSFDTQIRDVEARRDMQTLAVAVSDSLVRNPGYPANWTNETVQGVGLAEQERILSLDKILKLNGMMDGIPPKSQEFDYDGARSKLRLGEYEVMFYFKDYTGQNLTAGAARSPIAYYARNHTSERNAVASRLKEYGSSASKGEAVWDFYWGGDGGAGHGCGTYYCRYSYSDANPLIAFNMSVANRSSYRTIIIEDLDLDEIGKTNSGLNITGLVDFVNNGGILVVIGGTGAPGSGIIDQNFSAQGVYNPTGWGLGNITNPGYFLRGLNPGGSVDWSSRDRWVFRATGTGALATYVSRAGHPEDCMACSWAYGRGYVYYLEELNPVMVYYPSQPGLDLQEYAAIAGNRLNFGNDTHSGTVPVAASQMVTVRRTVLVDGFYRDLATMEVRVWKE